MTGTATGCVHLCPFNSGLGGSPGAACGSGGVRKRTEQESEGSVTLMYGSHLELAKSNHTKSTNETSRAANGNNSTQLSFDHNGPLVYPMWNRTRNQHYTRNAAASSAPELMSAQLELPMAVPCTMAHADLSMTGLESHWVGAPPHGQLHRACLRGIEVRRDLVLDWPPDASRSNLDHA